MVIPAPEATIAGPEEIRIVRADARTKSDVARMRRALYEYLISLDDAPPPTWRCTVAKDLENQRCIVLIARLGDIPVGTLTANWDSTGWAMLRDGWVDTGFRRKGVARALINAVQRELAAAGARYVAAKYQVSNHSAAAAWTSLGFVANTEIARKEIG